MSVGRAGRGRLPGRRGAPLGRADPAAVPRAAAAVRPGRRRLAARPRGAPRRAGGGRGPGRRASSISTACCSARSAAGDHVDAGVPGDAAERWQVPELAEITVVGGTPLAAGDAYAPAAAGQDPRPAAAGRVLMDGDRSISPAGPAGPVGPVRARTGPRCCRRRGRADWLDDDVERCARRPVPPARAGRPGLRPLVRGLPLAARRRARWTRSRSVGRRPPALRGVADTGRAGWPSTAASGSTSPRPGARVRPVVDLWARRLLRRVARRPGPAGRRGRRLRRGVLVLLQPAGRWCGSTGRRGPRPGPPLVAPALPRAGSSPARVAPRAAACCGPGPAYGVVADRTAPSSSRSTARPTST